MSSRRYVFSEMPYAMALNAAELKHRCSYCGEDTKKRQPSDDDGGEAEIECDGGCDSVVYCDGDGRTCMDDDRAFHRYECEAYRGGKQFDIVGLGTELRLMGRLIGRYRLDKGVADLSTDFPTDVAKNRKFDDLMSHSREFNKNPLRKKGFEILREHFYDVFSQTELATTPVSMLGKFYDRSRINGFGIAVAAVGSVGQAVYLNVSRFNHSCVPSGYYRFDGARIVIEYVGDRKGDELAATTDDDEPIKLSKKQFARLTLSYGVSATCSYGAMIPTTEQGTRSLKERYFFTCKCPKCATMTSARWIETESSPYPCPRCRLPYVWKYTWWSFKLVKVCDCGGETAEERRTVQARPSKSVLYGWKSLNALWHEIMSEMAGWTYSRDLFDRCQLVLKLAEMYWNDKYNLRLGQLHDRIFNVLLQSLVDSANHKCVAEEDETNAMIKSGKQMMHIYVHQDDYTPRDLGWLAIGLANLYKMRATRSIDITDDESSMPDSERAQFWYQWGRQFLDVVEADENKIVWAKLYAEGPPMHWMPRSETMVEDQGEE